jgi:hypothetical protein
MVASKKSGEKLGRSNARFKGNQGFTLPLKARD